MNLCLAATVDVKSRSITDISTDKMDSYLAVVEVRSHISLFPVSVSTIFIEMVYKYF